MLAASICRPIRIAEHDCGSSLVETALVLPVLVLMLCFAIDIGYFFIVAANLVSVVAQSRCCIRDRDSFRRVSRSCRRPDLRFVDRYRRRRWTGGWRSVRVWPT